jgi:hypothetical protein
MFISEINAAFQKSFRYRAPAHLLIRNRDLSEVPQHKMQLYTTNGFCGSTIGSARRSLRMVLRV